MKNIYYAFTILELTKVLLEASPNIEDGYWKINLNFEFAGVEIPSPLDSNFKTHLPGAIMRLTACSLVKSLIEDDLTLEVKDGNVIPKGDN